MSPELDRLIKLQHLETTIAEARAAIAAHPQRLADADARLDHAQRAVDTAKEQLKANHDARRALEKDVAVYQGRVTKFKDQLMEVKTNREYQAMQHEIATAQTELGAVEEKVIERMVEDDGITAEVKKAEAALAARQKEVEAEKKEMAQDLTRNLWKARFSNFTNQLDDTAKLRRLRREIARVKTVRTQKSQTETKKS